MIGLMGIVKAYIDNYTIYFIPNLVAMEMV